MVLAGQIVANPDNEGGVEISKYFAHTSTQAVAGTVTEVIVRRPNPSYSSYTYPRYRIRLRWTALGTPEYTSLKTAFDNLTTGIHQLSLTGLGITRREAITGITSPSEAYVTMAPNSAPQVTVVEGYREIGGVLYGPLTYDVSVSLLGLDVQYLVEENQ